MPRLYALLVGINAYPTEIGKLAGCLNDVDHFRAYLGSHWDAADLAIEVLKDGDATHGNVIDQFRAHLGRARKGDTAVFQYCGHGARSASAGEFRKFYPGGRDEGLVCVDSRRPGGFDLADKELAVLLSEVAKNEPHLAVLLDCCHSGSGTRGADAFRGLTPRLTHEVTDERPLETYLDGHYARLRRATAALHIPASRHILLAACERTQLAQESPDRSGVFTSTLIDVLNASGGDLTYADLFVRSRAAVKRRAANQDPQFEASDGFNANLGFLGRPATFASRRYSVTFDRGAWTVDCGAIHGLPAEPETAVALALYPEGDQARLAGGAEAIRVGPQKSDLRLDFASDPAVRYRAEITSLPVPPVPIGFDGDATTVEAMQAALRIDGSVNVALTATPAGARYALSRDGGHLWLQQTETGRRIQGAAIANGTLADAVVRLLPALKRVAQWERGLALQNPGTQMDASSVDFLLAEPLEDGAEHVYPAGDVTLDYTRRGDDWPHLRGKLKVRNRTQQTLHMALVYFSGAYGIHVLRNDPLEPGETFATLWGEGPNDYFYLDDTANESVETFKLIVSTERVDDFLLSQDDLEFGQLMTDVRGIGNVAAQKKVHRNEWFTRDCHIRVVRRLDAVGASDSLLADGRIVVKAHASVTANLSLGASRSTQRSAVSGQDYYRAFEGSGMELLNFSATRGEDQSVLELTDIRNAPALQADPLAIQVRVPLKPDEGILPLVFDGQHVVLAGDVYKDDEGHTHVAIDRLPEVPDHRRSLGGSLKLYFFKTYLKQNHLNQLRWIDYAPGGSFVYQKSDVATRVAAARNILLLVHGIIGDTEGMAAGVRACGLDRTFDLVLAYDYENLSTPIAETAQALESQLAAAGLRRHDDKRLTILAHSMGGLVSRWFIEREGGNAVVDHLVMCGTPNNGSPFGRVDGARKILNVLASLSLNYVPALIPASSFLLLLLNRSKALTPTLEQMHPDSDFIRTLNASDDPGIPYTILAGDVDRYIEPSDAFAARMLTKAGQSAMFDALFAQQANDIAVGVESILGVGADRSIAPTLRNVDCHHLNYFVSDAGQAALNAVAW